MAADILHELQIILLPPDFATIESFVVFYNRLEPEKAGQTRVCFEVFVESLRKRYNRKFEGCERVLSVNVEEMEQDLAKNESTENSRSLESEKRRNKGKMRRDCGDNDNRQMCDRSATQEHIRDLSKAAEVCDEGQRNAAIKQANSIHREYEAGRNSSSPVRDIEKE